jgi:tetratricopeptide (TPR) repeat protein
MSTMRVCSLSLCALMLALGCKTSTSATTPDGVAAGPAAPTGNAETGAPMTLEELAAGAVLLDGLGDHRRPVTTRSTEAQAFFDQGLALLYGFNHDEAARSFARAAAIDPSCAMCSWGAAITLGPNYNVPMLAERAGMAWEALQAAVAHAPGTTPAEQALIDALTRRYAGPEPRDPAAMQPLTLAYAEAMRSVAQRFPADMDVQVLFAEALMNQNPWKLWSLDGAPAPGTEEIVATLERVLATSPDHPGANHYYIHAVEASRSPERALPAAKRLPGLMPGAGHMVHMPAHIFQRVGLYAEASTRNREAVAADLAYMARVKPWGYYPMYLGHNYGFWAYSAAMEGRRAESLAAARASAKALPPEMLDMMPGMDFFTAEPLLAMVRFGEHDALLAEPRPDPRHVVLTGLWLHARGMALAAKARLDEAAQAQRELVQLAEAVGPELTAGNNRARDVLEVAARVLAARIAEREGHPETLAIWAEAVAMADELAYSEPADWFYPVRHYQGAALLQAGHYAAAEAVYRADLSHHPANGWALFGLARALKGQGKTRAARQAEAEFTRAWARADITLTTTGL